MITVIVPTLGRPDSMARLAANLRDATRSPYWLVFVVEGDDGPSVSRALDLGRDGLAGWCANKGPRNYASSVNTAYALLDGPVSEPGEFVFLGADDVQFASGWDVPCLAKAVGDVRVVGTNDLFNPYVLAGTHATHYLIDRRYLDEVGGVADEPPGRVLFEGYDHNYTDTEFIETAQSRGVFAPCLESVVEHLHVLAGKSPWDDTYVKGHAHMSDDEPVFQSRRPLWGGKQGVPL